MATDTSAELDVFDCNLGERGLEEFEPEPHHRGFRPRMADPGRTNVQHRRPYVPPTPERTWVFFVVPVIVAVSLLGAAVALIAMRPSEVSVSQQVPAPVPPAPRSAVSVPAQPPPEPAVLPTGPAAPPPVRASSPEQLSTVVDPAIEQTLTRVSDAYRALDAASLAAVWPGADTSSLSEAFAGLRYQALTFDRCRLQRKGSQGAVATCDVSITSASKEGDPVLQRRHESWTLALGPGAGDQWMIAGLTVR
jgi:hypothetical protein